MTRLAKTSIMFITCSGALASHVDRYTNLDFKSFLTIMTLSLLVAFFATADAHPGSGALEMLPSLDRVRATLR